MKALKNRRFSSSLVLLAFSKVENTGREANMSWLGREMNCHEAESLTCVREILFAIRNKLLGTNGNVIVGNSGTLKAIDFFLSTCSVYI